MSRKLNLQSSCLLLLLMAETIQAVTPDLASISSTRLVQMVGYLAEHGASCSIGFLDREHDLGPTKTSIPPLGSVPLQDDEPDEVCLASFTTSAQLTSHATGNAYSHVRFPFDLARPSVPSGCHTTQDSARLAGSNPSLIHSLCRLTC
jgi:hypothetical protein